MDPRFIDRVAAWHDRNRQHGGDTQFWAERFIDILKSRGEEVTLDAVLDLCPNSVTYNRLESYMLAAYEWTKETGWKV